MQNEFLIVEKGYYNGKSYLGLDLLVQDDSFLIYGCTPKNDLLSEVFVLLDGYVLTRNSIYKEYINKSQIEIFRELYSKYSDGFTNYIKGLFSIVIVDRGTIKIFNDQFGVNKFFYSTDGNKFCFSNSYKTIAAVTGLHKLNSEALATKALLNREVSGHTLLSNIYYSVPATKVVIKRNAVSVSKYWDLSLLLNNGNAQFEIEYFANVFKENIDNYHQSLKPQKTALTLTGGKDSRTALTALLSYGIEPVGVTYGNPVIVTNVGEIPDYLQHKKNAILCSSDDVDSFADGLEWVINNYPEATKIGIEGRLLSEQVFSAKVQGEKLSNFLKSL